MKKRIEKYGVDTILFSALLLAVSATFANAQIQPDLIVRNVSISKDASGLFVDKVTVVVANGCMNTTAGVSYVLVTFKQSPAADAKAIFYIGNTVRSLKGGESHVQTFDVSDKKIGAGRYMYVQADPYKKVTEASEDNNWRSLFPTAGGTTLTQGQCTSKL